MKFSNNSHARKAESPISFRPRIPLTDFSDLQARNALCLNSVTLDGMWILCSEAHSLNIATPMSTTPLGIEMLVSDVALKTSLPHPFKPGGRDIALRDGETGITSNGAVPPSRPLSTCTAFQDARMSMLHAPGPDPVLVV